MPGRAALSGHLAMLVFSALVAGSFAPGALIANRIAPEALTAVRFALAAAILGAVMAVQGGAGRGAWAAPWRYPLLGGVFAVYFVLMFEGPKTASALSTSAVFTPTPVMAAGFGWLLLGQRMTGGWRWRWRWARRGRCG